MRPAGFRAAGELIAARAARARGRGGRRARDGGDPARLRGDRGARRGRTWSPSSSAATRKEHGLQRWVEGPVEAGPALPRRRGHGHHRRLDRDRDRADPRGGARGGRRRRRRRPAGRRRREDRSRRRGSLPGPGHDRRDLPGPPRPRLRPAVEPDAVEIRVVGCLIEKQRTTPDAYPLSLNALRLACNQSTNRDPVVDYDEATGQRGAAPARAARLDPARQRRRQPRPQVPPPAAGGARRRRRRAGAAGGADAARGADAGRAEAAQRAAARLRRPRRRAGDARAAGRARLRRPPRAPAGPEGGRATSSCWAVDGEAEAQASAEHRRRR